MGNTYGRAILDTVGGSIGISADGRPELKIGGVTIDWASVVAVSGADVTLEDGVTVSVGEKYLRYGQVIVPEGVAEVQTITFTGGPTAGSAIVTLPTYGGNAAQVAAAIAFNATAAVAEATLNAAFTNVTPGVTVARSGAGSAGDPYIYTVTFPRGRGDVPQLTSTHTFTGGTTPTTTHATGTAGSASTATGYYGPYDSAAVDGRATLAAGETFVLLRTVKETDLASNHPAAVFGGMVYKNRLLCTNGTHSLAAGPTFAELLAVCPRLQLVNEP